MLQSSTWNVIVFSIALIGVVSFSIMYKYGEGSKDPYAGVRGTSHGIRVDKTRSIARKLAESKKDCVILYGSQTGTAEDYASRLAKEGKSRFGLETMIADLDDYDFEDLDQIPANKVLIFALATYGEGEPTDNAANFYEFICGEDVQFSNTSDMPFRNLQYITFGLGNNTYEHYNSMILQVSAALEKLGAHRIGAAGEGNDGTCTMEEDFLSWKGPMWTALSQELGLEEREAIYEPMFRL
jgi:NADPH-ferrihemoprotein reductase